MVLGSLALGGFVPLISGLLWGLVWVRMGVIPLSVVSGFVVGGLVKSAWAKVAFSAGGFLVGWALFLGTPTFNGAFLTQFGVMKQTTVLMELNTWMYKDMNGQAQRASRQLYGAMLYPNGVFSGFSEPGLNQIVTVAYVPNFPRNAVILTNDDSPYARALRCDAFESRLVSAQRAYEFARDDQSLKVRLRVALEAAVAMGCQARSGQSYAKQLRELGR